MSRFVEVTHEEWFAAPPALVKAQFADLDHHVRAGVHPKLRYEILSQSANRARYVQVVRLLGLAQRDVFEREIFPDGRMVDRSVEGFNAGGEIAADFRAESRGGRDGTHVAVTVRLPLPPVIGPLLEPLLARQVRKELTAAVAEDKHDIEVRGYPGAMARAA